MSTKRRTEEEALAANKELEKKASESAERIREDGGVWKVTLEDQAKYEAEHRKKKTAKASGAVSSKAGAAGGGYTPGAYYGGTDASAVKGKAGKTGAGSSGMSTGALKAALRRENDLQTAYRDYVQEAEAQAARQAKTPAMQRLKERKKAEIETAFDDYAENGLKDMYKAALEREVKQAREDEARNALFAEKALAEKSRENVRKANSSALDRARNSSVTKSGSAADFYKNRSETMGRGVIGDLENLEKIKNRDLGAELKLEGQKLKYQWEEAGRRYDALSEEEKRERYRKYYSSPLDRVRANKEPGQSGKSTSAQETRNRISNDIYERYKKLDEESRDPAKAEKYAFINRLRSAAGEGVENLGLWLYETFGYEPGKETYDRGEARAIGEVANEQVQRLVDAAPSQLGKDLVKVSDSVAQQLSYKILTAPISLFGGSIIADKVLSKTGSFAAAKKAARDFAGGTYTAGMASSSAADKYVQCRAEGQGKLEASVRAMGTGIISYFSESLGGIGGSKSPLSGLEEKYAESLIGSILYNAFEEGGEEFVEYLGDYLLDGAVDLAARGEWQQEWSWEEVIENAKIGAMSGGLFGGYNKLQNAVYSRIDEANAIRLEKAAREYSDYMKNAYRLMNDPNLREIAERRIGDTAIPSAMRTASRETGEMNFGNVLREKPGTVSAEQMYGVKPNRGTENQDFPEWNESDKKQAQIDGERVNALSLKERLTMIVNNVFPKTLPHVKLGKMPTAVKATIGIDSDVPLVMSKDKARAVMISKSKAEAAVKNENRNWHGLGTDGLEKVVAALENPLRAVKQENGRYGFVVEIEEGGKPFYVAIELDTKANYRGKMEKANVVVSAFGTDFNYVKNQITKGTELEIKKEPVSQVTHGRQLPNGVNETDSNGDVPSPNANIPQNGNGVNTLDAENSAAKAQQRKPGTVSAEQMYGVKLSQENKNEDFAEWAEKEDAKKKKAAEKEAILAEKQKNADNSNLTNREKYSLSEQEATEIKKGVSVITDADNNTIIDIKSNILENIPKEDWLARVKNVIRSAFSKGFSINGEHIDVSAKSRSEFTNSKDSAYLRDNESEIYADKMKTAPHLDIISQNANYENEAANHDRTDNIMSFDRGKVELRIGGKEYSAEVIIGVRKDGSKVFYDIVGMDANKKAAPIGSQSAQTANTEAQEPSDNISSNDSITDTSENFKSKSENSAAKVQQAETEEEARLRTLYESEPENGQKEAGAGEGGTDKTDKFIEDTQKRIEDAKITDGKLKEMPEDKQKEVLKDRAERAGLDMDAEELVDFAQSLGRIKGFFGREFKDFARVFDDVSGESIGIRNDLHKFFEVPHRQAQAQYTEGYKNAIKSISEKFGELGIKAGSKESAAVQRIGEHAYQIDSKGNTAEYTEEMLKREFPKDWKKIKAAADYCEDVYYDYLKKLNAMYESIYPNTVEKAQGYKNKVLERAAASQQKADNMREVKNKYERDLAAKKELLKKKKEGTRVYAETQNQILNLESKIRNAEAAVGTYESRAFADKTKAELLQGQIDSGEILKNKQIKPRKDYFRHFQEMNNSFREIVDVFSNDQNISPGLIGKSAETKPRAMWLSEAQERSTVHAYTEDAVGGMLRYAKTAETALAYDPLISKFRDLSTVIRTAATLADQKTHGTGTSAAKLAEYIDLWTNNIAGKSYGLDRWTFDAMGNKGRAVMKAVDKINGNVKGSLVMLNFNTALKQISNVPNATAYIPNPADWARGASVTAEAVFGKTDAAKALRDARSQSSFMNERYIEDTISDLTKNIEKQNILSKPKKFEAWLIGAGDRAAAELIWYTAYTHYNNDIAKAMKYMGRNYDSAIDYADDVTRRSVAGRGRGETALAETSKLMGLVAPFQVETNNSYQLLKEQIGKKNAAGVIALQVNTFLLNAAYTAAIGSGVLGFDFIAATLDVIKNAMGADKDDDVLDKIEYAVGRYGGELLSGMPMGAQIAEIITAGDSDFADKLFGDNNPAKFGNGIALASTLVNTEKAVTKARKGQADLIDVFDAVSPLIGRRQLGRTVKGARSMIEGGVYGYDSEGKRYLKYAQGNGVSDWVKALMMGQYATNAGREYVDGGFKSLSAKDTALMNIAEGLGISKNVFYDTVLGMKKKGTDKKKQEWLFANDKLTPEQKKIFDALYFGNGEEAVAAARKEADLAGAGTNKNDFYDILSGRISAKRDYGGEYEFENSGYTGKVQGQIRAAKGAEITREQLFSVLAGTKNKKLPDKMAEVYSTEGLTPEQQDKLGDIVLGDNGKGRRESYAAANVSISDRVLMEGILSDYSAQKKQTGDGEADELVKKTFIMDKLMAEGKSKYEAYRLYKIQDGKWANSVADISDEEKKRAGAAKKQYGLSESDYIIIKNYSGLAEGEKDKYGNTVSGSNREDNIKNLAKLLHCSEEEAGRRLTIATGCAYSVEELSSSARNKLETGRKYGWTDEKWLKAVNAIKISGVTKKEEKIKVLRDAGFSASEAVGYYNLNDGNDYYKSSGSGTPYGLNSAQYDKTKYYSEKSGKSEKEVAGYFKAIKGLTKKVDIIAALEAAGMSSSEANAFWNLRQGYDKEYKAYKNGE
nr:MAG TPA: hypothetical protein [Caudoviricetes sp.]